MAYSPRYQTQPVNFGDTQDDFQRKSYDAETHLTGYTSGITMPYSEYYNENGETRAQAIKSDYSKSQREVGGGGSTLAPSPSPGPGHNGNPQDSDRKSAALESTDGLTYIDEDFNYYSSRRNRKRESPTISPLVANAAPPAGQHGQRHDLEYADPYTNDRQKGGIMGFFQKHRNEKYPLDQQIENKKRGVVRQQRPYVMWALMVILCSVFIYEIVKNYQVTGSPFAFKPIVNPMIGPAQIELVTLGGRWPPCMKIVEDIPLDFPIACANNTQNPPTEFCTIEEICGFGGFNGETPNQWFRFITPIFLHAGLIHLALNLLALWFIGGQVEKDMGSVQFTLLLFAAGIFGNVFGGNFALVGIPSVGASGAICGLLSAMWVDTIAHWSIKYKPGREMIMHVIQLAILIGIGFIPGVDNFAHLGGFLMGLVVAAILFPVISPNKRHRTITWGIRIAMIPLAIILFVVLIRNFYTGDPHAACSWCRYLSCIPSASNNRCQGNGLITTTTTTT